MAVGDGLSTLSTPKDERALDGTGQAFAQSLTELRPFISERFPALLRSPRPKKPKKK